MNKIYTIVTSVILFLLFFWLFYIGIVNLTFRDILKTGIFQFFDFGKNFRIISIFYLIVVTIFFIVILAIMVKLFLSFKEEKEVPPAEEDAQPEPEIVPEKDETDFQEEYRKTFQENRKKLLRSNQIDEYKERVDELYVNLSQIIEDILSSRSYAELFEKTLFWAQNLSKSEKGSILLPDNGNKLYIYKITGRDREETQRLKQLKLSRDSSISGKVFREKKKLFIDNLLHYKEFEFSHKADYKSDSFLSIPIMVNKNVIAILNLTDTLHNNYTIGDLESIYIIVKIASRMFEILHLRKQMKE